MTRYLLALDQGTTSSRSVLVNDRGRITRTSQKEFHQIYPRPGWVEHDAGVIWQTQLATARECLREARLSTSRIAAIGLTNQRETTVVWSRKTGEPIANAIVWQDRRTAGFCNDLRRQRKEPAVRRKTGLLLDPYFSGTKIRWLLDQVPGARKRAERGELAFGTIDSWLVWNLTRGARHIIDVTNASRTLLFNIHTGTWDHGLLEMFGVPAAMMPELVPSSGELAVADRSWFGREIPITGIAGDQQAALFGQTCFKPGMIKNTYGTGCFLLMNTGQKPATSKHKLLTTAAWQIGKIHSRRRDVPGARTDELVYALEGSVFSGGSVVQWLRDGLGIIRSSSDIEPLAASVKDSGGVVLVPAFTGLGAPLWDASARGLLIGLTRGTTAAHIARAALESIAFQVGDVIESMQNDTGIRLKELRVDGGAAVNNMLMQFQADITGIPVVRAVNTESTAMGAAYLAGLGAGVWSSTRELEMLWKAARTFTPRLKHGEREDRIALWRKARARATKWDT